ncbi:MAG: Cysteine-tRNA ligase [Candidatus Roizmanbacteria bacterium GW2011_GWC2_37_13]|uniref:Cysteine--tRNA ligase n=1 Tax=Candidatus Roizmanbacteria bacterium GW2011_GWC2_37_13 TaxID=1618486 RepID=A0A0G0GKI8_9BACT|nr:MAG: cysteinyl-tRNA synthetase, cysteinyl-tRNA synthetase [Candidatus Roizmanbacteria bacterium GW2011_GWC1_37_12]KKQ26660.1 MAG: Cysteine-tRNA ligase [Candidatus Roizmanbacteria bacterium GW2011_GWC2_37_13]
MKLYNTLSRKIEEFKPINPSLVTLYTCGPTVYDYSHIGHMRAYVVNDLLKRTLKFLGYKVKHVMNITDVGHLTGDDDTGEDKLEKGAKKTKKTVWDVVKFFTDYHFKSTDALNILRPDIICAATEHIKEMIEMIKKLTTNGLTYETKEAVYFDVSKFPTYGKLSGQSLSEKLKGARQDVYVDPKKKNKADFALWFKRVGRFADHSMHWQSPWGEGFPGWHIECSAMSMKYLGENIDIHTGGIDHIPVHHENEIAQSEGVIGKQFVNYWFHYNFLMVDNQKMSKSLGNFYTLDDIKKHNIDPLALRYLFLQSHYRQLANFTWKSIEAANEGLNKLRAIIADLKPSSNESYESDKSQSFTQRFNEALANDFQIPQALAVAWEMLKSDLSSKKKLDLLFDFDRVFGLKLDVISKEKIPEEIIKLAEQRKLARKNKNFSKSDELRKKINALGFSIEDLENNKFKLKTLN